MKIVSIERAIELLGGEPEEFSTYYIFPCVQEDMYIVRMGSSLYHCDTEEASILSSGSEDDIDSILSNFLELEIA